MVNRFKIRRDGAGWRVRDTVTGIDYSARLSDKARAQRQADKLNANLDRIAKGFGRNR